jgi:hypothetical protein
MMTNMDQEKFIAVHELNRESSALVRINWNLIQEIARFINFQVPKAGWFPNLKKRAEFFISYCGLVENKFENKIQGKMEFLHIAIYAILLAENENSDLNLDKVAFINFYRKGRYSFGDLNILANSIGELSLKN